MEEPRMHESIRQGKSNETDLIELLDQLTETIRQAKGIPFSDNCVIDREDVLYWVNQIRDNLPEEIHQARWLLEQNRQVVASARQKAESILRETEQRSAIMINEHEITLRAREMAQMTIEQANQAAWQMRVASTDYARQRLSEVENQLTEILVKVQKNKKELK
jgi:cell division septum initiation protein DivIVA